MTIGEMAGSKNVKLAITCVVIGLALVLGIGLVSCSGIASVREIGANQAVADAAGGVVEDVGLPEAETELISQEMDDGTGTERPRTYPATKQQAMVKLHYPKVLLRIRNAKVLQADQKTIPQLRPRASRKRSGWKKRSASGSSIERLGLRAFPSTAR